MTDKVDTWIWIWDNELQKKKKIKQNQKQLVPYQCTGLNCNLSY